MISQMVDFTESQAFRLAGRAAFAEAGIGVADVDHLMIYDAFAHVPIYGLEALGFVAKGEAGPFIADGNTEPGGSLPLNTNGGGLSYTHTGMYGMFAIQEGVRQLRGEAAAQSTRRRSAWCWATAACSPPPASWCSGAHRAHSWFARARTPTSHLSPGPVR